MNLSGILWIVCQQTLFAGETAMVHALRGALSLPQIAVLRGIGILILAMLIARGVRPLYKTRQVSVQLLRGLVTAGYTLVFAYSFTVLPLADATAISYATTPFVTLFGWLILRERVSSIGWMSTLVGFSGAVLVAHPTGTADNLMYLLVLAGTSLNGLAIVLTRWLQQTDPPATIMFYLASVVILCFAPITSGDWQPTWLWSGLLLLGPAGLYAGILAVRYTQLAILAPWLYSRIFISITIGICLFDEIPDGWTSSGLAMILLSCALTLQETRRGNAKPAR